MYFCPLFCSTIYFALCPVRPYGVRLSLVVMSVIHLSLRIVAEQRVLFPTTERTSVTSLESRIVSLDSTQPCYPKIRCQSNGMIHHTAIVTATMIAASLKIATLFPLAAIRPNLPALEDNEVPRLEKVSFWKTSRQRTWCETGPSAAHTSTVKHVTDTVQMYIRCYR